MRATLAWIGDRLPPSLYFLLAGNSAPSLNGDHDMTETIGTLTWKQNYWAQLGYSTEALAAAEAGAYAQLGARMPLSEQVRLEAAAGYYWLDDAYDDSYAHAQLGGRLLGTPVLQAVIEASGGSLQRVRH